MPDQSQGACQAIEDAACLGLVFSKEHFQGDVEEALRVFETVRKPRGTKVQAASARARENINERIGESPDHPQPLFSAQSRVSTDVLKGFSSNTSHEGYKVDNETGKLTIDEMNLYDMKAHVAQVFGEMRGQQPIGAF